jgi:hypothetical protein
MKQLYEGVQHVVHISTNISASCEHCSKSVGGYPGDGEHSLAESINHYIEKHGYKLLHVGTETSRDLDGNSWHSTVAVLGKDLPLAVKRQPAKRQKS